MFLTKDEFLKHFPMRKKISRDDFIDKFKIMYTKPITLRQAFSLKPIKMKLNGKGIERKPIMKGKNDFRYKNREKVIDFFYQMLITHRHYYLGKFYQAYFRPKNPFHMKWNSSVDIRLAGRKDLSMQKNDASKTILRNLFYKELLHETRITNTIKNRVSFWESLVNLYNKFELEDRFFAPSSIELFLRPKTSNKMPVDLPMISGLEKKFPGFNPRLNYHNLFYLFQAYQPKASIMNPYFVHWILENVFKNCGAGGRGKKMFTPVLSWLAYLVGFFHTPGWSEYVGNDIMKSQCQGGQFLADWYHKNVAIKIDGGKNKKIYEKQRENDIKMVRDKQVKFYCQPSEKLAKDQKFLNKYSNYFDLVLICPPYFDMEIYEDRTSEKHKGKLQSTNKYKDYDKWLEGYWRPTANLCYKTCAKDGCFALIINNYFTLTGDYYPLVEDCVKISKEVGFKVKDTFYLFNRTSPLRVNNKDRTERLIVFHK